MNVEQRQTNHNAALLDAAAAGMRAEGQTFRQIGDQMGVSPARARERVNRHYRRVAGPKVVEAKRKELATLDDMERVAMMVMESRHVMVSHGHVVTVDTLDGKIPLSDHGPVLESINTVLRIQKRRSELEGYDAPRKSRVEVITKDVLNAEIDRLERELAQKAADDDPDEVYDREELADP